MAGSKSAVGQAALPLCVVPAASGLVSFFQSPPRLVVLALHADHSCISNWFAGMLDLGGLMRSAQPPERNTARSRFWLVRANAHSPRSGSGLSQ